jgi:hypothetical protein
MLLEILSLSLHLGFCTYMLIGNKYWHTWYVSAFGCLIVCVDAGL